MARLDHRKFLEVEILEMDMFDVVDAIREVGLPKNILTIRALTQYIQKAATKAGHEALAQWKQEKLAQIQEREQQFPGERKEGNEHDTITDSTSQDTNS